jgi:ribosomal protein S18 acetylase RimI-like enzyme
MTLDLLRWGGDRLRVGPWRGDAHVAYIAPLGDGSAPSIDTIRRCCEVLAARGFTSVVTAALGPREALGFVNAGFEVREHLHLLAHDLLHVPAAAHGAIPLRRGRRADRPAALAVDGLAFEPFWRLDDEGLEEALTATPSSRFRISELDGSVAGYVVSGRAAKRGFVQRLAVDPVAQRRGIGAELVLDALRWMQRRSVERAVVNTQESNAGALALYEHLGFRRQSGGLSVLHAPLP